MFGKEYVMTRGVERIISNKHIQIMAKLIEDLKESETIEISYHQIFRFITSDCGEEQVIQHLQYDPDYSQFHFYRGIRKLKKMEVWVIDDGGEYATFLLPQEY